MFWEVDDTTESKHTSTPGASSVAGSHASATGTSASSTSSKKRSGKKKGGNVFGGPAMSKEFEDWCKMHLTKLVGSPDTTLVEFLMTVDSEEEIREHLYTYLGKSGAVREFASGFLQHKNFQRKKTHTVSKKTSSNSSGAPNTAKPSPAIASSGAFGVLGVQEQSEPQSTVEATGKKKRSRNRRRKKR